MSEEKRDVGFAWTPDGARPRYFVIRVGEGAGKVTLHLSEAEAQDLFGKMEAYRGDWQMEPGVPTKPKGVELTKTEARDVFEVVSEEHLLDLEKHHLKPNVRKNLEEAQMKLQLYVWPGLCGPWGCHGEHGSLDCNRALCESCKEPFDICKCEGGPVLRVRN